MPIVSMNQSWDGVTGFAAHSFANCSKEIPGPCACIGSGTGQRTRSAGITTGNTDPAGLEKLLVWVVALGKLLFPSAAVGVMVETEEALVPLGRVAQPWVQTPPAASPLPTGTGGVGRPGPRLCGEAGGAAAPAADLPCRRARGTEAIWPGLTRREPGRGGTLRCGTEAPTPQGRHLSWVLTPRRPQNPARNPRRASGHVEDLRGHATKIPGRPRGARQRPRRALGSTQRRPERLER